MPLPKVVIVGRPNVGKSSLLNWIAGRRIAIVEDISGVTRDRVSTLVQDGEDREARFFELMDNRRHRHGRPRRPHRGRRPPDRDRHRRGGPDPLRRRHPRRPDAAGRGRGLAAPLRRQAGDPRHQQGRQPLRRCRRRGLLQARPRQARLRLHHRQPEQAPAPRPDHFQAPARRRQQQARRRGDEDRRRRPPQHRQIDLHQHPRPRRADDRLRAPRHDEGFGGCAIRTGRIAVHRHRHRRRPPQGEAPRRPRLLLPPPRRAVDPKGRRRPPFHRPHPGDQPARPNSSPTT